MVGAPHHRIADLRMFVPGYTVLARAWDDPRTITFNGKEIERGAPVFIKTPKARPASPEDLLALRRDNEIARSHNFPGILPPLAHLRHGDAEYLVFGDDGIRPVGEVLLVERPGIALCLEFAVRLTGILDGLHRAQIIHKNLNPYSVWFDLRSLETKISDFSLASRSGEHAPSPQSLHQPQGDLRYIAPEQTGRIPRGTDPRSDLYSFGALFYHIVTGKPPFDGAEVLELLHAHLARLPLPPHAVDPRIPKPLSEMIMKLLAKAPEERYQTARGLEVDLRECLSQWHTHGRVVGIVPGARDAAAAFRMPRKLYGRERPLAAIREALERAGRGSTELALVEGAPGVGKSELVRAIEPAACERGAFISAKFDQFKQNEPYSVIAQAFRELTRQLLSGSEERLQLWRRRLGDALGKNGRVITDVVPDIELIIGPQPAIPTLPPAEKRNRFNRLFRRFVRVFARADHLLTVFLDDLQWADPASLELLKTLVTDPGTGHFLVIGAHRNTEAGGCDPIVRALDDLSSADVSISCVKLSALEPGDVADLLRDALQCEAEQITPLAALVFQKTDGNPFFISQFLSFLQRDGLIEFDYRAGRWIWDLRRISARGITEDVLELMSRKFVRLPALTKEALKSASCMGSRFDLARLALVTGATEEAIADALWAAEHEGLILQIDAADPRPPVVEITAAPPKTAVTFQFLHDRVQQAAYALIPPEARQALRLKIGRMLLTGLSLEERQAAPFEVLDNLNAGAALMTAPTEHEEIARLNLAAGRRARDSAAYDAALGYFRSGMDVLAPSAWRERYELAFDLHLECFECAYVTGHMDDANQLFLQVLANAKTRIDKSKAYYTKILLSTALDTSEEAIGMGIEALQLFGQKLPIAPTRLRLLAEICRVMGLLRGRRAQALQALPPMTDPDRRATIGLLMSICPAAYFLNPDLMALAALRIVGLSLRHGNANASSFGYVLYALIRGALFGDYKGGHEFGRLAIDLAERSGNIVQRCKIVLIFAGFINFWREPIETSIELLRSSLRLALDCGDIQYANYSILQTIFLKLACGAELDDVYAEAKRHENFVRQTKDGFAIANLRIRLQYVLALKGETAGVTSLADQDYDEEAAVSEFRAAGNMTTISYYLVIKLQLAFLFGDYQAAARHAQVSEAHIHYVPGQIMVVQHYFFYGLTAVALLRNNSSPRRALLRSLARCRAKLRRWARNAPQNFLAHHLLLEAEIAACKRRREKTERLFDEAIAAAKRGRLLDIEALANELAGQYFVSRDRGLVAASYLQEASAAYGRWGAGAKVTRLVQAQAPLLARLPRTRDEAVGLRPTAGERRDLLDLDSVMRASVELSSGVEADRRLSRLMRVVLESVGGERGFFITMEAGALHIEAAGDADGGKVPPSQLPPAETEAHFSAQIVIYVLRTGHDLVLEDARADTRFASCPYIRERQPRSILCMHLSKSGEALGAIYVENNLAPGIFGADRLSALRLLSQQVAVAVENARLSRYLKENDTTLQSALRNIEVLERVKGHLSKFVPQSLQKLIETNPGDPDLEMRNEDVSILFLDMAGYTSMSEQLDSEELNEIIETYFSSYIDDIHDNGGDISEIAGDGLMILFRDPDPLAHARAAARTALRVRAKTARINNERRNRWPPIIINIGINSGVVLIGASKINSQMGTRWTYTANGYNTNLAARIGGSAVNGAILVSETTALRLDDGFALRDAGDQTFKGISRSIKVFSIAEPEPV